MRALDAMIEQAKQWRAFHKARGAAGYIEALAASIRIKALNDARCSLSAQHGEGSPE